MTRAKPKVSAKPKACKVGGCPHAPLPGTDGCAWHSPDEADAPEPKKPRASGTTISEEERARRGQSKVLLRLSADLTTRLAAACRKRNVPRAAILREALEAHLDRPRPKTKAKTPPQSED